MFSAVSAVSAGSLPPVSQPSPMQQKREPPTQLPPAEGMVQGPPPTNPVRFVDPATGLVVTQFYSPPTMPKNPLDAQRAIAAYRASPENSSGLADRA
jgi:hypothetical protein